MSDAPLLRMFNYPDDLGNTPLTLDMSACARALPRGHHSRRRGDHRRPSPARSDPIPQPGPEPVLLARPGRPLFVAAASGLRDPPTVTTTADAMRASFAARISLTSRKDRSHPSSVIDFRRPLRIINWRNRT